MPSPARAVLVLACLALALAGWWIWGGAPDPIDAADGPASASASASAAAAAPTPEVESAGVATLGAVRRDEVNRRRGAESVAVTIRVVGPDGAAASGAEVGCHVDVPDAPVTRPVAEKRAWAGEVQIADARGEVVIREPTEASWTVFARTGVLWGYAWVSRAEADRVHVVELARDVTVRARVVDGADRPVGGVRVALTEARNLERGVGGWHELTHAPDGVAEFEHVQARFGPDRKGDAVVALACPLSELVFAHVDLEAPPADPVFLRLPTHGSVRLTLVDETRRPIQDFTDSIYARLRVRTGDKEQSHWLPFRDGVLALEHFGLGLTCRAEVESPEFSGTHDFVGPQYAGERVVHEIVVARHATIAGRLVDEHGTPQAGYWYASHIHEAPGYYNQYFETADDGRFHLGIPELEGERGARRVVFRRTLRDFEMQAVRDLAALVAHQGRNEIGDVVLGPAPLLAAGHVVDDAGEAVAGVELFVFCGDPDAEWWSIAGLDEGDIVSAEDGAFFVRGHSVGGPLMLRGELDGQRGEFARFEPGVRDLSYVMPRMGAIELPVEFAGGLGPADVLHEVTEQATGRTRSVVSPYVLEDGVVRWAGLPGGRYDLSARVLGSVDPLFELAGVEVEAGGTVRLPARTLGAELETVTVHFVDESGKSVERASVVVDPGHLGERPRAALRSALGVLELRTPRLPIELLVFAPGFASQRVRAVAGDVTIRLERGPEVELRVSLPDGFPPEGHRLLPTLRPFDASDPSPAPWNDGHALYLRGAGSRFYPSRHEWLWNERLPLGQDGRAVLHVPGPGTYAVEWELAGRRHRELGPAARRTFVVDAPRTVVDVSLSADDVDG